MPIRASKSAHFSMTARSSRNGGTASVELRAGSQDSVAQLEHVGKDWKISSLPKS